MQPRYLYLNMLLPLLLLLLPASRLALVEAQGAPLWMQPSNTWLGIDGNWSTFTFEVGTPGQMVNLLVGTTLSETWIVETGGCDPVQACYNARGGVFNISASSTWESYGTWSLGLTDMDYGGNGDYGLDTLAWTDSLTQTTQAVKKALIGGINSTAYFEGLLGLGATPGNFSNNIGYPLIQQLVEDYGAIPSYSYGFTAGAYYAGGGGVGVPASLTLGGFDTLRFEPHGTNFTLDAGVRYPTVLLRGITASVASVAEVPTPGWTSTSESLMGSSPFLMAVIDSATPFLWLPPSVCDDFAAALNLTWSDALGVYTISQQQYAQYQGSTSSLSLIFTLSSYDNEDNFGQPLDAPNVVNITVSANAFAQALSYPFGNINYTDPAVPYFPLKRSNGSVAIIGRAFLQEAYLIMHYEASVFSVHQALFPANPATNYSLQAMPSPANSGFPGYAGGSNGGGNNNNGSSSSSSSSSNDGKNGDGSSSSTSGSLSTGAIIGIVLGAAALCSVIGLAALWCWCRRHRRPNSSSSSSSQRQRMESKSKESESVESERLSPVRRMLSVIIRRKRSKKPLVHEVHGSTAQPVEVGADAHHEVYELPAPHAPAEMDAVASSASAAEDDTTVLGSEGSHENNNNNNNLSAYEIARRKMERQLQGPVPAYTPPLSHLQSQYQQSSHLQGQGHGHGRRRQLPQSTGRPQLAIATAADHEKSAQDVSPVAHYRPSDADGDADAAPPNHSNSDGGSEEDHSLGVSLPSPVSPTAPSDWPGRMFDVLPSPLTIMPPPLPSPRGLPADKDNNTFSGATDPSDPSPGVSPQSAYPPHSLQTAAMQRDQQQKRQRHGGDPSPVSRSNSSTNVSPISSSAPATLPVPTSQQQPRLIIPATTNIQRTPIGPSRVICLGPLPDNVRLPRLVMPDGRTVVPEDGAAGGGGPRLNSVDSLGSNFTVEEEDRIRAEMGQAQQQHLMGQRQSDRERDRDRDREDDYPRSPHSMERIETSSELVHVPQVADRRYSWEEER